ncbi:MAG: DNA adenine methylase [Ktedonobacterales bacterium]|nr:DNA adenine methylase [Ktedonobacterales bacterium]
MKALDLPTTRTKVKPFLKWAGGKGRLLAQYAPYLPRTFGTYHEPFCGGGAVFFHLVPAQAVLSDINPELVNVYACVRDEVAAVCARLSEHAALHSQMHYYATRALKPLDLTAVERAARFIYLNRTCYNGLYRENAGGGFNVPMGRYVRPTICDTPTLLVASAALAGSTITQAPFEAVLARAVAGDLVYFDPPYQPLSATSNFTSYSRHGFGEDAQVRLRDLFVELTRRGVRALLSNSDCAFTRDLYRDFRCVTITAGRAINTRAERRGKITELLVLNWDAEMAPAGDMRDAS